MLLQFLWLRRCRRFIRFSVIYMLIHGCPLNHDMNDKTVQVVEGPNKIGFSFAGAIGTGSRRARVDV